MNRYIYLIGLYFVLYTSVRAFFVRDFFANLRMLDEPLAHDHALRLARHYIFVILLHPPLPLVGVSIVMERGCHQIDSLADG